MKKWVKECWSPISEKEFSFPSFERSQKTVYPWWQKRWNIQCHSKWKMWWCQNVQVWRFIKSHGAKDKNTWYWVTGISFCVKSIFCLESKFLKLGISLFFFPASVLNYTLRAMEMHPNWKESLLSPNVRCLHLVKIYFMDISTTRSQNILRSPIKAFDLSNYWLIIKLSTFR